MLLLLHFVSDYKRTSLAKYIKYFDQFLDGMARSWKGERLRNSGRFLSFSFLFFFNRLNRKFTATFNHFAFLPFFLLQIFRKNSELDHQKVTPQNNVLLANVANYALWCFWCHFSTTH